MQTDEQLLMMESCIEGLAQDLRNSNRKLRRHRSSRSTMERQRRTDRDHSRNASRDQNKRADDQGKNQERPNFGRKHKWIEEENLPDWFKYSTLPTDVNEV